LPSFTALSVRCTSANDGEITYRSNQGHNSSVQKYPMPTSSGVDNSYFSMTLTSSPAYPLHTIYLVGVGLPPDGLRTAHPPNVVDVLLSRKTSLLCMLTREQTNEHPFIGPFSGTIRVSQYQKGKTNPNFTEARQRVAVASAGPYASLHLAPDS